MTQGIRIQNVVSIALVVLFSFLNFDCVFYGPPSTIVLNYVVSKTVVEKFTLCELM